MDTKESILEKLSALIKENNLRKNEKEIRGLFEELKVKDKAAVSPPESGNSNPGDKELTTGDTPPADSPEGGSSVQDAEIEKQYKELWAKFREQQKQAKVKAANEMAMNLEEKKTLLEEVRKLIQEEENIGKAYARIAAIHKRWKEIGPIPADEYHDIQNEYGKLNETFYYNINIYKELKEHDLKKNYSLKNQIIHQLDELQDEKHIKSLERKLNELRNDWDEIGPTYKQQWEVIREKYWEKIRALYEKISKHYESEKEKRKKNQEIKEELVEQTEEILEETPKSHKDWSKKTDKIKKLQKKWKKTGGAPRKQEEALWKEFRTLCDKFFSEKSDFYEELREENHEHRAEKEKLVETANELKDSKDWDSTTEKIIQLQKKWKRIGNAGPKHEYKLWNEFRGACDHFFDAKKTHYAQMEKEASKNVSDKEAILEKVKNIDENDAPSTVKKVNELIDAFVEAGAVPSKLQAKMHKGFEEAVRKKLESAGADDSDTDRLYFRARVENIKLSSIPDKLIDRERRNIRKLISKLKDELIQYENNMGFFSNSKGAEKLLAEVKGKVEKNEEKIERLKEQLKQLRELEQ